jgi:hypothetical protein
MTSEGNDIPFEGKTPLAKGSFLNNEDECHSKA